MTDLDDIRQLLAQYCVLLDADDHETWLRLFLPDASFLVYGRSFDGHEGLLRMATNAPGGLHLGGQPVIEIDADGTTARTTQNLLFVDRSNGESRGAVYDDVLVRTDEGWRFASRRCRFVTPEGLRDRP